MAQRWICVVGVGAESRAAPNTAYNQLEFQNEREKDEKSNESASASGLERRVEFDVRVVYNVINKY